MKLAPARRRILTVLFTDLSDSSGLAERMEAEEFWDLIELFRGVAHEVVPRHGGFVARMQGDGLLALFGYPDPREDDGRRAAEAALDLTCELGRRAAAAGLAPDLLRVHSGIHAGLVLTQEGDIERGRVDVVGEVVNTAARLCGLAGAGELLASEDSLGPHAQLFEASARRRAALRGRSEPLDVLRIGERRHAARRIDASARRGVVPFVGRSAALQWLAAQADPAGGGVRLACVTGEAGVGKTRLLDEFVAGLEAGCHAVLRGGCENYLGAELLQPFMQCLRPHAEALAAAPAPEPGDEKAQRRHDDLRLLLAAGAHSLPPGRRAQALVQALRALAAGRIVTLVLDDWQWSDDASRQALQAVVAGLAPLRLVVAQRTDLQDDDPTLAGAARLALQPLDAEASARAVAAWLPQVDPFTEQAVVRASGGSPLFIEELCHSVASGQGGRGAPAPQGSAWLFSLVASRLARMPGDLMALLQVASVAGMALPGALLDGVAGPGSERRLREADLGHGMLQPGDEPGELRFRHGLTRDAVYGTVDLQRRRELHLRVAQWVEATGAARPGQPLPAEALAHHYLQAGRHEQAAQFAEQAGDRALAAMALDRARAHFLAALDAIRQLPMLSRPMALKWCSLAERLGQTCVFDPLDSAHGLGYFDRAAALAAAEGDVDALARAEYWTAYVNYGRGRPRQAVRASEAALQHAQQSGDPRLVAQVQATLGQSLASAGQSERALALLEEAVRSKREHSRPGSGTAIGSAYSLGRMGYTLGDLGRFDEAAQRFAEAFALLGDVPHSVGASVRELVCAVQLWQGRWQEAFEIGLEGAELAFRCRSRYLTAMGRALAHCGAWALREDEASLRALHDATVWIEARGGAVSTSLNYGWLVHACRHAGDHALMRRHAAQLMQRARLQDTHGLAHGCRALARDAHESGRPDRVAHYLSVADRAAAMRGSAREVAVNQLARAELARTGGDWRAAGALAARAQAAFERMAMPGYAAQARALQAG
jgi:class 3 adenylate cyclase/tetratricopeptide (TPR) repeat protein